jgi:predicted flap endonuclease-1-like 5' DNA nuclease
MNKEPESEMEAAEVEAQDEPVVEVEIDADSADGAVRQMLPPSSDFTPPPPQTRFNTAAPLAPPRPNQTGTPPPRPSNVPPVPRLLASQAAEKIAELQEQLEAIKRTLAARDAEIRTLLTQRDARISELESVKSQLAAREFSIKELEFAVLAKETKVRDLEKEMESLRGPGEEPDDDLQQIRGIGRGFERELKRMGVRTFTQIAAWTPGDIEEIAPRIKAQAERIRRDGWVQHASELVAQRTK